MLSINNFEARIIFSIGKLCSPFLLLNQSRTTMEKAATYYTFYEFINV